VLSRARFQAERSGQSGQAGTGAHLRRHRQGHRWRAEKSRESLRVCALIETPVGLIEFEFKPSFPNPMNNDELRELNKRRKIHQLAWVTRDLEKSMKAWVDNLKVGPWTVLTFTEKTLKYLDVDGKRVTEPFKFLIGISWIGEIQVELIQPVYGPMIYEAFIQKHGEGLHHFKERISLDDIDEVLKEYKEKGIEVTQTGQFKEDFHYYLNTEPKLEFVLELGNCPLLNLPKNEFPTYPPEKA